MAWGTTCPVVLREGVMKLLGKFISVREPNVRYLGLSTMAKRAKIVETVEGAKNHQDAALFC